MLVRTRVHVQVEFHSAPDFISITEHCLLEEGGLCHRLKKLSDIVTSSFDFELLVNSGY